MKARSRPVLAALVVGTVAVLVLGAVAVHLVGGRDRENRTTTVRAATFTRPPRVATIGYEVNGRGRTHITYFDPARNTNVVLPEEKLPWRIELPRQAVEFAMVSANRHEFKTGEHVTRILVDGVELCRSTHKGVYLTSVCAETVPRAGA